jgi:hypothetical protein
MTTLYCHGTTPAQKQYGARRVEHPLPVRLLDIAPCASSQHRFSACGLSNHIEPWLDFGPLCSRAIRARRLAGETLRACTGRRRTPGADPLHSESRHLHPRHLQTLMEQVRELAFFDPQDTAPVSSREERSGYLE